VLSASQWTKTRDILQPILLLYRGQQEARIRPPDPFVSSSLHAAAHRGLTSAYHPMDGGGAAPQSVSTNGSNRPNSQTWHRLAVWTVGALVAGIRSKTRV